MAFLERIVLGEWGRRVSVNRPITEPLLPPLSREEFYDAYLALTNLEQARLLEIARWCSFGTPYEDRELLHEAIARTLEGRRHCPRTLPIPAYLKGVMLSIAWDAKEEGKRYEQISYEPQSRGFTPEQEIILQQAIDELFGLFENDPEAQEYLRRMMEGERGAELQGADDRNTYNSVRKRIDRRLRDYYSLRKPSHKRVKS